MDLRELDLREAAVCGASTLFPPVLLPAFAHHVTALPPASSPPPKKKSRGMIPAVPFTFLNADGTK
jgi:hypothetical protein